MVSYVFNNHSAYCTYTLFTFFKFVIFLSPPYRWLQKGMASHKITNKNVSVLSAVSWCNRAEITTLKIILWIHQGSYKSLAIAWHHIRELHFQKEEIIHRQKHNHFCCQVCLIKEQEKCEKTQNDHGSHVVYYKHAVSTNSMSIWRLSMTSEQRRVSCSSPQMTMKQFLHKDKELSPPENASEISEDIALWFALDLKPFISAEQKSFKFFMAKNIPQIELPDEDSVTCMAPRKLYLKLEDEVTEEINQAPAMCLPFDGWTDKYKVHAYLGLRAMYIMDWEPRNVMRSLFANMCKQNLLHLSMILPESSNSATMMVHQIWRSQADCSKSSSMYIALFMMLISDGSERTEHLLDLTG